MTDKQRIEAYFAAFNGGDTAAMLEMVDEQVVHHVNQGRVRQGKALFEEFNTHMTRCYRETLEDIVVFEAAVPGRVAAEFIVSGEYLATDEASRKRAANDTSCPRLRFSSFAMAGSRGSPPTTTCPSGSGRSVGDRGNQSRWKTSRRGEEIGEWSGFDGITSAM